MTTAEVNALVERYEMDPGIVYELTAQELQVLLSEVGEMEPVVDAINVLSGASVEQRARDIGCMPEDFIEQRGDELVSVKDLELWASTPWDYGV
jgi:hypothetical protein